MKTLVSIANAPLCSLILATLALAQSSDLQTWTASDGRVLQAKFIKLNGEAVVIEKDGQQHTVPFARLAPASVELAKKLGAPVPATAAEPGKITSLWALDVVPLRDPTKPDEHVQHRVHELTGGRLFCSGISAGRGFVVGLLDATSGKLLWQSVLPLTPEETAEGENFIGYVKETKTGILLSSTSGRVKLPPDEPNKGRFYVRLIDPATGALKAHIARSWSDPEKNDEGERPPGLQYPGELLQCGSKVALVGVGYVAELADDLSTVTHHCKIPVEPFLDYAGVEGGVLHNSGVIGDPNKTTHFARFGSGTTYLPPAPEEWKAKIKSPHWQSIGSLALIDLSLESGEAALGGFDVGTQTWKWKSDAKAKRWGLTGAEGKWLRAWPELPDKRRVFRICDGATGVFTIEQAAHAASLHENGHVVFTQDLVEGDLGNVRTQQEISRFDCASGRKLWSIQSRTRGFYYTTEILPDGRVLLADLEHPDKLKLELIDEKNGQPASIQHEITPPPRGRLDNEPKVPPSPYSHRKQNITIHTHGNLCVLLLGSHLDQVVLAVTLPPRG